MEKEITKYTKEFINRNLLDISYLTRKVDTLLRRFFTDNNKDVKINFINKSFINYVRDLWRMERNFMYRETFSEGVLILVATRKILYNLK